MASFSGDAWKDIGYGIPFAASTSITGAGTYPGGGLTSSASAVQSGSFEFDPADHQKPGKTLKMRCIYRVATNAVAPGQDLTFDIRPISLVAGGSAANTINTLGSAVTSSDKTIPAPAASNPGAIGARFATNEFTPPAAGVYVICLTVTGAFAASSRIILFPHVQVKNV